MTVPLAYFLTWTTYGTWLPGDRRGWVSKHDAAYMSPIKEPDPNLEHIARARMTSPKVILDSRQRELAGAAIREICGLKDWLLHQLEVRSNHVHAVVSAGDIEPGRVLKALKINASKLLNQRYSPDCPKRWWTEDGSKRRLFTEEDIVAARKYVMSQDTIWQKHQG